MSNNLKYNLLQLMRDKNMNAMQLATKCQVHVQTVYNWAKITKDSDLSMPADKMKKLASIFQISMEEMYNEDLVTA
jgi:transposase